MTRIVFLCKHCRHPRSLHKHYRQGSDCGRCGCNRFRWL